MDIKTLDQLRAVDERSRRATPGGFATGGYMSEEDTARVHQERIASADLVDAVPDATRAAFERVRLTFSLGTLEYELFTVADALVRFTLELALRERFVAFTDGSLVFTHDTEGPVTVHVDSYDDVTSAVGRGGTYRPKAWRLSHPEIKEQFHGTLPDLRDWARTNGLLRGQVNRVRESAMFDLRNMTAHPTSNWTMYPSDVADTIRHTAELINQLWGCPTPGGRYYPAPLTQRPYVYGWSENTRIRCTAARFLDDSSSFEGMNCAVFAVCDDEPEPEHCHSWYDLTVLPSRYLYGPASPSDTDRWLREHPPVELTADPLDRLFIIVAGSGKWPIRLETLSVEDRGLSDARFHVIKADSPGSARALAALKDQPPPADDAVTPDTDDPSQRATYIRSGSWDEVRDAAGVAGDAAPVAPFDTAWPPVGG